MVDADSHREHDPLLAPSTSSDGLSSSEPGPKKRGLRWFSFKTVSHQYRWVPLLGCTIIFLNEAEYFIKQVATMRAIEAMYCYEYYLEQNSPLVELGKRIPEQLCKHSSIQKQLAKTAGLITFVRMLSAMIGAIPLGWAADLFGRKLVLILHKVNVCISCTAWVVLCKYEFA
jgi:hypothetical protein